MIRRREGVGRRKEGNLKRVMVSEFRTEKEVDASQGLDWVSSRIHPSGPAEGILLGVPGGLG